MTFSTFLESPFARGQSGPFSLFVISAQLPPLEMALRPQQSLRWHRFRILQHTSWEGLLCLQSGQQNPQLARFSLSFWFLQVTTTKGIVYT